MNIENKIIEILMQEATRELSLEEQGILTDFAGKSDVNNAFIVENRTILNGLPSFESSFESMFSADEALMKVKSQIRPETKVIDIKKKATAKPFNIQRWAAIGLLLIGLATITYTFFGNQAEPTTYTALDKVENVVLPDGSEVLLNNNSYLTLDKEFGNAIRAMNLEGEAFFKVKHDADQPFTVKSKDLEIEVLGTQFNIDADKDGEISVYVKDGKVKVTSLKTGTKILLTKGESSSFDTVSKSLTKDKVARFNEISWIDGKLRFENTSLDQVIKEIEEHFNIQVTTKNKALFNCQYTSIFNGAKAEDVLETLSAVFNIQLMKDGDNSFVLSGGSCGE